MSTLFPDAEPVPSPGFFKDSYQDAAANLFDHSFGEAALKAEQSSVLADSLDLNSLGDAPSAYPYPMDFSTFPQAYRTGEPTPPASAKHSPAQWPLDEDCRPGSQMTLNNISGLPILNTNDSSATGIKPPLGQITPPDDVFRNDMDFLGLDTAPTQSAATAECSARPSLTTKETATSNTLKVSTDSTARTNSTSSRKTKEPSSASSRSSRPAKRSRPSRRSTAAKAAAEAAEAEAAAEPVDEKRTMFLERNRVAAFKCRQKKKEQIRQMEDDCRDLTRLKSERLLELETLNKELFGLKNQLLEHARGGCTQARDELKRLWDEENRRLECGVQAATSAVAASTNEEHGFDADSADEGDGSLSSTASQSRSTSATATASLRQALEAAVAATSTVPAA